MRLAAQRAQAARACGRVAWPRGGERAWQNHIEEFNFFFEKSLKIPMMILIGNHY
jgi:hypothetical protein